MIDLVKSLGDYYLELLLIVLVLIGLAVVSPSLLGNINIFSYLIRLGGSTKAKGKSIEDNQIEFNKEMLLQYGKIMHRLIELNQFEKVFKLFEGIKNPNTVLMNIILKCCAKSKNFEKA